MCNRHYMNTIFLLAYSLLSERVTGSGGGRGKSPIGFVTSDSLPAGTYKAVEQNGIICPELPRLVSFEMVVTNGWRGQLASFEADVLSIESSAIRHSIDGPKKAALVWYSYSSAWALRQFGGSLRVGRSPNCFHVEPKDAAYGFLFNFYKHLNLVEPSRIASQLVFCRTEFGIFVGIGRKSNAKNDRHWKPTAYGFRIALSEGSPGDRADDVPEKSRKRSSYFQAGGGPLKLAKREEGSDASDGSVMSSHESPFSGLPLSGGGYLRRSDDETGEGSSTFGESDLSQPGVAFRAGTVIEEWEGKHVVPYGEAGNRVSPPIIPDAEYETLGTGLDNVWKITVNVRTDTETHQRWVGLRLDLGAYEWPVYFPEVTADSHEDCLYLDYSDQEHSGDLGLLGACIPFHPGPLVYPRICRDAGGGWSLRFNKTGSSGGTDGESPTPFTIDIKLHAVLPS